MATFTEITPAKGATFATQTDLLLAQLGLELANDGVIEHDVFASIYNPGKLVLLVSWSEPSAQVLWTPAHVQASRHRKIRIVRDYGMFDRRESPQFYPDGEDFAAREAELAR